jgi:hypothetical protein
MVPGVASSQKSATYVFFAAKATPLLCGYRFTLGTGLSSRSSYTGNSTQIGTTYIRGGDAHPNGSSIAYAGDDSPYLFAVSLTSTTSGAPTIGTRFSAPSTAPQGSGTNNSAAATFSPDGRRLIYNSENTPFVEMYAWSSSGFGSRFSNPATLPPGAVQRARWSGDSQYIGVASSVGTNYITAYATSGSSGWGSKLADPSTKPTGACSDIQWSPSGSDVMAVSDATPFVFAYAWNGASSFGTKYSNPATIPSIAADNGSWSPSGQTVMVASAGTVADFTYPFTSGTGFGTRKTAATNYPTGSPNTPTGVSINHRGDAVSMSFSNTTIPVYVANFTDANGVGTSITVPTGYATNYNLDTFWVYV